MTSRSHRVTFKVVRCNRKYSLNSFFSWTSRLGKYVLVSFYLAMYDLKNIKCTINRHFLFSWTLFFCYFSSLMPSDYCSLSVTHCVLGVLSPYWNEMIKKRTKTEVPKTEKSLEWLINFFISGLPTIFLSTRFSCSLGNLWFGSLPALHRTTDCHWLSVTV